MSILRNCNIYINGNGNRITINSECVLNQLNIWIEDSGNVCEIGCNTWITGNTHIAIIEGTKVEIGDQCLFSSEIVLRTGDSHSLLNLDGQRINPSEDIQVGRHTWIGNRVTILKGSQIGRDCVVGTGAVVNKRFMDNTVIAGVPGKIVRDNIRWCSERI